MTVNFKDVPAALLEVFNIDKLYLERAPFYRWFIGLGVDAGMLKHNPVVTLEQAAHFQNEALRLSQMQVDPALLNSPAAKVAAIMGQFGMSMEARWFYDPFLHRSTQGYGELVGVKIMFEYIQASYGEHDWFTSDFQLTLLTKMISMEPVNLKLAFEQLYFGPESVGWMNAGERQGAIEAVKEAMSPQAQQGLGTIWKAAGGKPQTFKKVWQAYVSQMLNILVMVAEKAHEKDVRLGRAAYDVILKGLRIGHTVDHIYMWAVDQYQRIAREMYRLAALAGYDSWQAYWDDLDPGPEMTDKKLVAFYKKETQELLRVFGENGIIPPQPASYDWKVVITPPENRQSIPSAMYMAAPFHTDPAHKRLGSFYVTPPGDDYALRLAHWVEGRLTAAHEVLGHGGCNAYDALTVPGSYNSIRQAVLLSNEGVTVTMESASSRCNGITPTLQEMMAQLKNLAWRCARIIAEVEWHVYEHSLEQITLQYAQRAGISSDMATRDIRRATTEVWEFLAYALGAAGIEALGTYMGGTLKALRYMIEQCAGLVPQNLVAWAEGFVNKPEDFYWLVQFELPDISQALFPDTK